MHNFFHQKFDDRWRLCQHEKKISHYEQVFLFFDDRNEFYEILLHFFQIKTKKKERFDLHSKKISDYNKNNEKFFFTSKKNIWNWNNHWIVDQSNENIIVEKTSDRRLCSNRFHFKKKLKKKHWNISQIINRKKLFLSVIEKNWFCFEHMLWRFKRFNNSRLHRHFDDEFRNFFDQNSQKRTDKSCNDIQEFQVDRKCEFWL